MNTQTSILTEQKQIDRVVRGYNIYINGNVDRISQKEFLVQNNGKIRHIEDMTDIGLVCTCEDQQFNLEFGVNGDRCKHIIAVEFLLMDEQNKGIGA